MPWGDERVLCRMHYPCADQGSSPIIPPHLEEACFVEPKQHSLRDEISLPSYSVLSLKLIFARLTLL